MKIDGLIERLILVCCLFALLIGTSSAGGSEGFAAETKVVIQASSGDAATQSLVLNNAANLQEALGGMDKVQIEVVAYGPGLALLTAESPLADRVKSMAVQNVRFSACENTMAAIERRTGKRPELASGVVTVASGIARIVELDRQGYTYVRP
jgi:intracellular sulfur oxidation DsrE/DsrF family protein